MLYGRRQERSRRGHRLLQRVREGAASARDERLGIRLQRHGARRAQDPDAVEGPQGSGGPLRPPGLRDRWTTRAGSECFVNSFIFCFFLWNIGEYRVSETIEFVNVVSKFLSKVLIR